MAIFDTLIAGLRALTPRDLKDGIHIRIADSLQEERADKQSDGAGSAGFNAWLLTTNDQRPLSDYMTVLFGTAAGWAQTERERAQLIELAAGITDIIHTGNTERVTEAFIALSENVRKEIERKETTHE